MWESSSYNRREYLLAKRRTKHYLDTLYDDKRKGNVVTACQAWKKICLSGARSDVILQVGQKQFPAHKMVLEGRSSVFAAMFSHDMVEKETNVVEISDVDPDVFGIALVYIYSGLLDELTTENAFKVYEVSDKYDLQDLKESCALIIGENLSTEIICDVIAFADRYKDSELQESAIRYVEGKPAEVFKTEAWLKFKSENKEVAFQFLEHMATPDD